MIVVDANLFIRAMTEQGAEDDPWLFETSTAFFRAAREGELWFTSSEAILAEVVWVMSGRYRVPRETIAHQLRSLLNLPGCRMPTRNLCIHALNAWATHRPLSFVDALVASMAELEGHDLATLDQDLARYTSADVWSPDPQELGRPS